MLSYTQSNGVIVNILTLDQYRALRAVNETNAGEAYSITDIDTEIDNLISGLVSNVDNLQSQITALENSSGSSESEYSSYKFKINKYNNSANVSSFEATSNCYEVVAQRTYDISCMLPKLTESNKCLTYTIEVNVGSTAYNVNFIVSNGETIKWRNGQQPTFQTNKTYVVTIKNGLGSYEVYY